MVAPDVAIEVITSTPRGGGWGGGKIIRRDRRERATPRKSRRQLVLLVYPALETLDILELAKPSITSMPSTDDGQIKPPGCRGHVLDLDAYGLSTRSLAIDSHAGLQPSNHRVPRIGPRSPHSVPSHPHRRCA